MKTVVRLNKKCNLGNYSDAHKYETFDLTIEREYEGTFDMNDAFKDLREQLYTQEHDTILFFLENSHEEDTTAVVVNNEDDEIKL